MGRPVPKLEGCHFGELTVICRMGNNIDLKGHKRAMWRCRCACGKEIIVSTSKLKSGQTKSCGCKGVKRNENGQFIKGSFKDISGKRFGKLTVIKFDKIVNRKSYWIVKCDCGTTKSVRSDTLKVINSCGCDKRKQDMINLNITNNHKLTYHPAYHIWHAMMDRCHNPNNQAYGDYGGRGIKVCDEWKNIRYFAKWADESGFIPNKNLSIERKDVNGNYCPENCIWIDKNLQTRNRRNTIKFSIDGIEKPLSEWAEIYGMRYELVIARYERKCRNAIDLFFDGNLQMRDVEKIMVNGEELTKREIANKYGVKLTTINARVKRGILDERRLLYKGNLKELK